MRAKYEGPLRVLRSDASPAPIPTTTAAPTASPQSRVAQCLAIVRRIIGAPDYDTYLAHMSQHHPGKTPMSRHEFGQARMKDRYSSLGSRCC